MKKRTLLTLGVIVLAALLALGGCGAAKAGQEDTLRNVVTYTTTADASSNSAWAGASASNVYAVTGIDPTKDRLLITNAEVHVQTKTFDAFVDALNAKLKALGGYLDSAELQNYDNRSAGYVARVPSETLEEFLSSLEKNGTVTSRSQTVRDATDEFIDTDSKRKALETERDALMVLLAKGESVSDLMQVQERLSIVRAELDSYVGKLQSLKNQIDYSTVSLSVMEVERISPLVQRFGPQARDGFVESLRSIGAGVKGFALWLVVSLPYFVLIALLVAALVFVIKALRKRRKKKKAA
jgi:metal-responsive CopG/Arc/MetJ family transcriptional regulator